jgi:hypothetical protein
MQNDRLIVVIQMTTEMDVAVLRSFRTHSKEGDTVSNMQ